MPDPAGYFARWSSLHGGYDPRESRLIRTWLALVCRLARPLARAGVAPDLLTLLGLLAGAGVVGLCLIGGPWVFAAALLVVLSGVLDALDGAVAVLADRVSAWGGLIDSLADRVVEGFFLVSLWVLGAPGMLCVVAGALTYLLEYGRARAGGLGMTEIGTVTVGERPTRVIVTSMFMVGVAGYDEGLWAVLGSAVWAGLGLIACFQLLIATRRALRE